MYISVVDWFLIIHTASSFLPCADDDDDGPSDFQR